MTERIGGLEVDQDLRFQRREWLAQRVGWGLMALVLVAALTGLFGRGPAAARHATAADRSMRVDYDRFVRKHAPSALEVTLAPAAVAGGGTAVWLDRRWADRVRVERITPAPERVTVEPDRLVYFFAARSPGEPVRVDFELSPERVGDAWGRVGVVGGAPAEFRQFVYP